MVATRKAAKRKTVTRKAAKRETAARKAATRKKVSAHKSSPKRWSQNVTEHSDAMDLKHGVFRQSSAKKIAMSLKHSAESSSRRKSSAYRSAMSMLTFYINRAGKTLPKAEHARLERAKDELKKAFGKE